jgi:4-hydroxybenzoate polyprenyltransferase
MPPTNEMPVLSLPQPARLLSRKLFCIRFDEVFLLQGPPVMGAIFSFAGLTMGHSLLAAAAAVVGSICLVAHVFVLNDWAGIDGDLRDPNRATWVFTAKGVSRTEMAQLAVTLLAVSLMLFAFVSATAFVLALAIAGLSALYSAPMFHMKGLPILNSILHLVGGTLHFLLGYATFSTIGGRGFAIACFFGLVFAAGHLTHEARDRDGDLLNRIQTNAVAFGKMQSFVAGFVLFTAAYALLIALAAFGAVPRALFVAAALYPLHFYASVRTLRAGLTFESLSRLQTCYRLLYAVIGIMMLVTVLLS